MGLGNMRRAADSVVARSPRLWPWHLERAGLLVPLGRINEACRALTTLKGDLQQLPAQRRATPAMHAIESGIDQLRSDCLSEQGVR